MRTPESDWIIAGLTGAVLNEAGLSPDEIERRLKRVWRELEAKKE